MRFTATVETRLEPAPADAGYSVRVATPADETAVTSLLRMSYGRLMPSGYDGVLLDHALPLIARANPVLLASGTYHVAETVDGSVIGCGGWTPGRPATGEIEPRVGHVRHFATHPDWTGRGVGRAIHDCSRRQALAAGITRLTCYSSINAEPFYAALGFRTLERIHIPLAEGLLFPAMLMESDLAPPATPEAERSGRAAARDHR